MRRPRLSLSAVVLLVLLVVLFAVGAAYLYPLLVHTPSSLQARSASAPTHSSAEASPSPLIIPPEQSLKNWRRYENAEYRFSISYPPDWTLTRSIVGPSLSYPARTVVNLYTSRVINPTYPDQQSVVMTVAVYDRPAAPSIQQWLSTNYHTDLGTVKSGYIDEALAGAYAGEQGIVSYDESEAGSKTTYELGIVREDGRLSYTTIILDKAQPRYVYAIEILLEFEKDQNMVQPPDSTFVAVYKKVISTFRLL